MANDMGDPTIFAAFRLTALWRDKQLQYTWLRAAQGRHADFWQVTYHGEAELARSGSNAIIDQYFG